MIEALWERLRLIKTLSDIVNAINAVTSDQILAFLTMDTEGQKPTTKRFKYTLLKTFFNFIKSTSDPALINPYDKENL